MQAGMEETTITLSLDQLPFDNETNQTNSILNIEFSSRGEMMVVSYDNMKSIELYDVN